MTAAILLLLLGLAEPLQQQGQLECQLAPFPPYAVCLEQRALAWSHQDWLYDRAQVLGQASWQLAEWRHEADYLANCWSELTWAQDRSLDIVYRQRHLDQLRELLGEEALRTGTMPPPVPWWRFQDIDP